MTSVGEFIAKYWGVGAGLVALVAWAVTSALSGPSAAAAVKQDVTALELRVQRVESAVGKMGEIAADMRAVTNGVETLEKRSLRTWDAVNSLTSNMSDVKSDVSALKAAQDVRDRLLPVRK